MTVAGIGIDVANVDRVSRLYAARGDRFAARWFTTEELAQCRCAVDTGGSLAVRFTAKEAVWKALGAPTRGPLPWREISVIDMGSQLHVELSGSVQALAESLRIGGVHVSAERRGRLAIAFAVVTNRS